jgi:hypothetical protein
MEVTSIVSGILVAQDDTKQLQIATTVLRSTAIAGKIAAEKAVARQSWPRRRRQSRCYRLVGTLAIDPRSRPFCALVATIIRAARLIALRTIAMKFTIDRPYADPDKAARRLMQHAHAFDVVQELR